MGSMAGDLANVEPAEEVLQAVPQNGVEQGAGAHAAPKLAASAGDTHPHPSLGMDQCENRPLGMDAIQKNILSSLREAPTEVVQQATAIAAALHAVQAATRPASPCTQSDAAQSRPGSRGSERKPAKAVAEPCTSRQAGRKEPQHQLPFLFSPDSLTASAAGKLGADGRGQHPMVQSAEAFLRDQKQLLRQRQMSMQEAREEWQKSADALEVVEPSSQRDQLTDMLKQVCLLGLPCWAWTVIPIMPRSEMLKQVCLLGLFGGLQCSSRRAFSELWPAGYSRSPAYDPSGDPCRCTTLWRRKPSA